MVKLHEPFYYRILFQNRYYVLQAELIYQDETFEHYKISTKKRSYIFKCNWPVFRNRGLKHRKPDWQIIDGQIHNKYLQEIIIKELENSLISLQHTKS